MFNKITKSKIRFRNVRHPLNDKFTKTKKIVDKPHIFIKHKNFSDKLKLWIGIMTKKFSELKKPFIIAEIGNNHEGSFSNAMKLIDLAAWAGATAVKFQTYKVENYINPIQDEIQKTY